MTRSSCRPVRRSQTKRTDPSENFRIMSCEVGPQAAHSAAWADCRHRGRLVELPSARRATPPARFRASNPRSALPAKHQACSATVRLAQLRAGTAWTGNP